MSSTRVVLVGLGGYGNGYVDAALDRSAELGIELAGAVDPDPRGCARRDEVAQAAGTIHPTLESFYESGRADLAVISAPIHLHAPFTVTALEHDSHVLCEKPVAGTEEDAARMAETARRTGHTVAIGFQWSFSETIHRLRRGVASGRYGTPLEFRTLVFWPRSRSYYTRNSWAGALRTADGASVYDSPANNATAHYLHNMLFVLGEEAGGPASVAAELYRANPIESFDTGIIHVKTAGGTELHFATSHAVPSEVHPMIWYRFSDAEITCSVPGNFYAQFKNGRTEDLGSPEITHADKLRETASAIREGHGPACSVEEATPQLRVVHAAHQSHPIVDFPSEMARTNPSGGDGSDQLTWVDGLQSALIQCHATGRMPSELGGVSWARAGSRVDLSQTPYR